MSDPIQIGDFRIERQIGAGGMGIVYLATQVSLNRKVALKVLGQSLTRSSDKQRFQREAQSVAKLNHPNIAKVHYVGQDDRLCYMAMEYIDGVSLRDCIERLARTTKPDSSIHDFVALPSVEPTFERFDETEELAPTADYSPDEGEKATINPYVSPEAEESISTERHIRSCVDIVRDVANAVQHAHERGVIHRDIKPENLVLDKDGKVHIIDFGVARFFEDATLTQTGALIGTPIYMSPEQASGRIELDARTDIYSLGIVLYELLVLRQPITAMSRDGVFRNIALKPLRPVSWFNSKVPEPLQNIVHKATAKDPDDRYQTARELADDANRYLTGGQVLAPRYRWKVDYWEIRGRRPTLVLALVMFYWALFLFTVIGISGGYRDFSEEPFARAAAVTIISAAGLSYATVAWAMASGRKWAAILALLTNLVSAAVVGIAAAGTARGSNEFVFQLIMIAVFVATGFCPLVDRKTRDWFEFARRVRSEEADGTAPPLGTKPSEIESRPFSVLIIGILGFTAWFTLCLIELPLVHRHWGHSCLIKYTSLSAVLVALFGAVSAFALTRGRRWARPCIFLSGYCPAN
jgi:serine/threonine protein kinase